MHHCFHFQLLDEKFEDFFKILLFFDMLNSEGSFGIRKQVIDDV